MSPALTLGFSLCWLAEWHLWVGPGPPCPSQVLGNRRRPSQRHAGLLLLPHWLAACAQAPRCHREGTEAGPEWHKGWQSGDVPAQVSGGVNPSWERGDGAGTNGLGTRVVLMECERIEGVMWEMWLFSMPKTLLWDELWEMSCSSPVGTV